jgi:16S rRNA (uracil1498-N3)-methyltransferase
MRRFFINIEDLNQEQITLPENESKHACRVLRMKVGQQLELVNGKGGLFTGEITDDHQKKCIVSRIYFHLEKQDSYHIHLAIAPTKSMDRLEWFLEKATEFGIHEVSLILCENAERKRVKMERIHKIVVAAMKQSKRLFLPTINELQPFEQFVKQHNKGFIAHCYDEKRISLSELLSSSQYKQLKTSDFPVLIGPEGDFTKEEVHLAMEKQFKPVLLGQTRLRTETAGLYACMQLKNYFEEIHNQ